MHPNLIILKSALAVFVVLAASGSAAGQPPDPLDQIPTIEWIEYPIFESDSRLVFVSSTDGDDATAKPGSVDQPFRTIKAAMRYMQNGYPDVLLLRCGDRFDDAWGSELRWRWSGRSEERRMLVTSYGTGPRPIVTRLETEPGGKGTQFYIHHVAFRGIHFTEGVDIRTGGEDLIFEDCCFEDCDASVQGFGIDPSAAALRNVRFNRCVFDRNWKPGGRPQNLYCARIDGLRIEGCVFWRGGWDPDREGAQASHLNHNAYLQQDCYSVEFRGNISADPSSHGVQMRRGGVCEGNLFLQCPIAITFGSNAIENYPESFATGVVRWNAILGSRDIDTQPRGHAMWFDNLRDAEVYDNIIANNTLGSAARAISVTGAGHHALHIHDNLIYHWTAQARPDQSTVLFVESPGTGENRFTNNTIVPEVERHDVFSFRAAEDAWTIEPNHIAPDLEIDGLTIEAYMQSLGLEGGLEEFMNECLKQRRQSWRDEFTAIAVVRFMLSAVLDMH